MQVQLTYIPAKYWSHPDIGFKMVSSTAHPPSNVSFFFVWVSDSLNLTEPDLNNQILKTFPSIPVEKLSTCILPLAIPSQIQISSTQDPPNDEIKKNRPENSSILNVFPIVPIMGKLIPLPPAFKLLYRLNIREDVDRTRKVQVYSDSVKTYAFLTKLTLELLSRGNFIPYLAPLNEKEFEGQWRVLLKTHRDHQRFKIILRNAPWSAYNLPLSFIPFQTDTVIDPNSTRKKSSKKKSSKSSNSEEVNVPQSTYICPGIWHPSFVFVEYMDTIADFLIRASLGKDYYRRFEEVYGIDVEGACQLEGNVPWDLRFLKACISKDRLFKISKFCDTPIPGLLRNWVQNTQGFSYELGVSMTFRLEYPKSENAEWPLGFYLQPLHNPNQFISLKDVWSGIITQNPDYANACEDEGLLQQEILRALGTATKLYPPIANSLEGKNPSQVKLSVNEVMEFMRIHMYLLIQNGFNVVLPEEFTEKGQQRLSARLIIKPQEKVKEKRAAPGEGVAHAALFDMNSLLEYKWEARLENNTLTSEEFQELAQSKAPLVYWRDHWVLVDQQDMEALRPIFSKSDLSANNLNQVQSDGAIIDDVPRGVQGTIPYMQALKLGMVGNVKLQENGVHYQVAMEGDFLQLIDQIAQIDQFPEIPIPSGFKGELRPYQQKGLTWLASMTGLNFGIILADDMGLGKTVQVIALLLHRKNIAPQASGSTLIICPTSVIFNWHREIQKFAPELEVKLHYGTERIKSVDKIQEYMVPHRIILTSYGTIRNDLDLLGAVNFAGIIIDEAQNIKNYKTQQTQAIIKLKSQYKICLSGTPIENRLLELWSLFEVLNPGLLGPRRQFQNQFILPIERFHDEEAIEKLRRFISPFILRRLKSDKSIIQDLPEKNEMKVYLELTPEQSNLYKKVVDQVMAEIEAAEDNLPQRRGLILKLLIQLKQICNHPFQYLHLPAPTFNSEDHFPDDETISTDKVTISISKMNLDDFLTQSSKMLRLLEMVDEVLETGQKLLIFTQFKQMGDLLQKSFEEKYDFPVLFLHGGIIEKKRREMVDEFQSDSLESSPIMILSLRAGGTGLNLTQASTVFHFDRWWNPAVENQATDRAYRIGQKHQVNVYKFIASGTIEEKIDNLLEEKRTLADQIVTAGGESWITELSKDELRELFSLGTKA